MCQGVARTHLQTEELNAIHINIIRIYKWRFDKLFNPRWQIQLAYIPEFWD